MKLQKLSLSSCVPSKTNTKGRNEGVEFKDLVLSIKEKGVLTPILVRPMKKANSDSYYEIVAGHRRYAAAFDAGLEEIPAMVIEMTDTEAREAQIVENLQRSDIHPLDEGEAYRKLIEESDYKLEDVSAKVGKSITYIRDRLVLTNLSNLAKKSFRDGEIKPSHASLIARLDDKQQKDAVDYCSDTYNNVSVSDLREWIQDRVLEDSIKNPPWKGDAELENVLVGCEECQGKSGDLFGKKASESCTNPKCFANRLVAYVEIQRQKNPNLIALTANYSGGQYGSKNEELIGTNQYKEINSKKDACDHEERGIILEGRGMGCMVRMCRAPECKKHWKEENPGGHYKPTPEERAKRKIEKEKAQKELQKSIDKITNSIAKVVWPMSEKHLGVLVDLAFRRLGYSYLQPVATRHGIKAVKKTQNGYTSRDLETPLSKYVKGLDEAGKLRFVFEVILESTGNDESILKKF